MKNVDKKIEKSKVRDFLDQDTRVYLKKPKSWQRIYLWWENNDRWFLNKAYSKKSKNDLQLEKSVWITMNDLDSFILFAVREGYEIYIDNDKNSI